MTQAFLSEPSLAEAHEKYLESWTLPTVRARWNNRRPSLKQFEATFGEAHSARQAFLNSVGQTRNAVLDDRRVEAIQELVEASVEETLASLNPPRFAAPDADEEPETQGPSAPEARTVKPKNMGKLPTTKQLYFYLHRAIEAGHKTVTIPVTRGEAARGRSMMAEGKTYPQAIIALRK